MSVDATQPYDDGNIFARLLRGEIPSRRVFEALVTEVIGRVADKWTMLVVRMLGQGPRRFNALRREVGEISQKMLASTLRDLEENGFVSRVVVPTKPPQVEYALTDLGRDLLVPVSTFAEWVIANSSRIEEARAAYAVRRVG